MHSIKMPCACLMPQCRPATIAVWSLICAVVCASLLMQSCLAGSRQAMLSCCRCQVPH